MLLFAILFFSTMTDTGLFDPLVARLVKIVHGDPLLILLGTVVLCAIVSLDGDGSTTYIITIAALLPLYKRFDMNRLYLVCLLMVTSGIMNLTPWGGPTARAASALKLDPATLFLPLIPGMIAGLASVLLTGRIGSTRPNLAMGWELDAVTIVILGGVAIEGGRGSIVGVILAAVLLGSFTFAMGMLNVTGIVVSMVVGGLLIVAMVLPLYLRRFMARFQRNQAVRGSFT